MQLALVAMVSFGCLKKMSIYYEPKHIPASSKANLRRKRYSRATYHCFMSRVLIQISIVNPRSLGKNWRKKRAESENRTIIWLQSLENYFDIAFEK